MSLGIIALACNGCGGCEEGLSSLQVVGADGDVALELCVGVAATEQDRKVGLTGRDELSPEEGLLLDFPLPQDVCIQNETVGFAIDIVFVDDAANVVSIAREVPGGSTELICQDDIRQVLEVAGGVASGVKLGASVKLVD